MPLLRMHFVVPMIALACGFSPRAASAQITAESEPNDTAAAATGPLTAGVFVAGSIANSGDHDFYSYVVPGAGRLTIGVHGPRGAAFGWTLRDSDNAVVAASNQGRRPETQTVTLGADAGGKVYTIDVTRTATSGSLSAATAYDFAVSFVDASARPTKPGTITNYFNGTTTDSPNDPVDGPAMLIMGGGSEVDNQFIQKAYPIVNGGNIVVIRASGTSGYQTYLYSDLVASGPLKPASVETIVVNSTAKANDAYTSWAVSRAEMVWFAGGDQSDYVNYYAGTALEQAVVMAYNRGAVIGGTSAGAMILGEYVYDPDGVAAVTSADAIANPYRSNVLLTTDFFRFPIMRNIIVDTHTQYHPSNPNRLGRLATFMARLRTDGPAPRVFGVGPDDSGGIFINRERIGATQYTPYSVWVLYEDGTTDLARCASGQTLIYNNLWRFRSAGGSDTFDFNDAVPAGGTNIRVSVNNGAYTPTDWYDTLPVGLRGFRAE